MNGKQFLSLLLIVVTVLLFTQTIFTVDTDTTDVKVSFIQPCYRNCTTIFGADAFYDFKLKECWSCPKGYTPTIEGVRSRRACIQYKYGLYADAKRLGKIDCGNAELAQYFQWIE